VLTADAESDLRALAQARGVSIERLDAAAAANLMCDWYETHRVEDVNLHHDGDMLLFQWGTYSWNGDAFSYDITRQFIVDSAEDDDAIWHLALTVLFDAATETESLGSGSQWCYRPDEVDDFRSFVAASPVTAVALSRRPVGAGLRFEQAG
jgi:hypothetical protein